MHQQPLSQPDGTAYPDLIAPLDPRRVVGILRRRIRLIVLVTLTAAAVAAALAYRSVAQYRSTAVIRVRDARAAVSAGLGGEQERQAEGALVDPIRSLIEVLKSRGVAATVVESMPVLRLRTDGIPVSIFQDVSIESPTLRDTLFLEFWESGVRLAGAPPQRTVPYGERFGSPGFSTTVTREPGRFSGAVEVISSESAVSALRGGLEVLARPNTDIIDVHYTSVDPDLARSVAGRLVEIFRRIDADMAQQVSRARREFLQAQLAQIEDDLGKTRKALADFRVNARAYSSRDRFASEQAGVSALQVRRAELDGERRLYNTLLARLSNPAESGDAITALLSAPGLTSNPVVSQVASQLERYESQRDSLTTGAWSSAASNPDVQRLNDLISSSRTRLAAAVRSLVSVLDARIAALDGTRNRELASFRELSGSEERETELTEDVETARRLAEQLRVEYQRARLAEAVDLGQVELIDNAGPARRMGRSPVTVVLFGIFLGVVGGCVIALITEYLTPSIRRQDELTATLDAPGSIVIPRALASRAPDGTKFVNGDRALVTMADASSGASEAYRALRTTLLFSQEASGLKSIMVTSALAGEGKTTVAANLAVVFAQQGVRVLLVDCDLRRARLHHLFHVQRTPGLTTLLAGSVKPNVAIRATKVRNLSLLPAGAPPPNPAELLGGQDMAATLEYLVGEFDLLICDSPPLLAAADASILATRTEGVLMVVRAGKVEQDVVRMAQQQLTTVGARVVAAVLNDPDSEVKRYGGDYYFAGYGSDYHDEEAPG